MLGSQIMEEIRMEKGSVIITGASGSMGREAAKMMAQRGFNVILACRNPFKGEEVRDAIIKERPETGDLLSVKKLDVSSPLSIKNFVEEIRNEGKDITALFNNAGVISRKYILSETGYEQTLSVNYIGPVLLTELLLPLMPDGSNIVNMVSLMCNVVSFSRNRLFFSSSEKFNRLKVYASSKLALMLYSIGLSKRLNGRVKVNVADPGVVNSNMLRFGKWFDPLTDILFRPFCKSPSEGVLPAVEALCSEENLKLFKGNTCKDIPRKFLSMTEEVQWLMEETNTIIHNL